MALTQEDAIAQAKRMIGWRNADKERLDDLYAYIHGKQQQMWLSASIPNEVKRIAKMCRVNVLKLVIDTIAQSMYVDGYRAPKQDTEAPAWAIWQKNRMDARQIGLHRAMLGYGVAYTSCIPGEPVPVINTLSPRDMTTVYGEDPDWPVWALEKRRSAVKTKTLYRLFDETHTYYVSADDGGTVEFVSSEEHGLGRVPVVRYLAQSDLDDEVISEIDNLMVIQDQIEFTTFGLLVVQHYGAFAQKYIAGWLAESEEEYLKATASKVWTFEDPETKAGQFDPTPLDGYIKSREDSLKNLAAIAQLPPHALRGELVNLSAEALAAAEKSEQRKITEKETMAGESHEQTLELAGEIKGIAVDPAAQVRWKDMEARAFAATVDGLGKLAQMLQIPVEELWEKVPGATQQDVERWKAAAAKGDSLGRLEEMLDRKTADALGT